MKPKDKSIELVDKFVEYTDNNSNTYLSYEQNAKQCALIAVDEIVKELYPTDIKRCEYWKEVKKEIDKL